MSVAGRRGVVLWNPSFAKVDRQPTFDTLRVRFGFMVPFAVGDAVHVWDLPVSKFGGPCKGVRLRPDPAFRRRVLVGNWVGLAAILGFSGLFLLALATFVKLQFVPAAVAMTAAVAVGGLGFWLARPPGDEGRHRDIRLLLGRHDWGASDPATWADELVAEVVAPAAFGVPSFAALADRERAAGRYREAMWAARLCAAVEDEARGEELTDAVLAAPEVADRLKRVRKRPPAADQEFGPAPGLAKWVGCNPREHVLAID